ncbi:ABC transporter substrate-binding protein [Sporolactobacillus spathodeae]|uniref:Peptide/nickel transport system substrate-binding protein n=1 Tax=Sporolactobacillus spathodeae TaxID=1465502 RepID=A0ABS2Q4W3_9BACL|nr:ABC transporter substrate-binding protein [Sporolactobacillus spathodeae]MBM7656811.1 peptide/nickel transport system substrate-binding protein [Sporolactobacillus spathodeae]
MSNHRTISKKGIIATALALILLLSGCAAGQNAGSKKAIKGGTLTYGRPASVTSFDLFKEITSNNAFAIDKVFEPLVSFDKNGKVINWLAKSYKVSSDGLTYTFVLRDGLKFSNGKPVTARDAAFSIKHHLSAGGPLAIEAKVDSVIANNKQTLVIKLKKPFTPFLAQLANFSNGIIPYNFDGKSEKQFFKKPIGTGPFAVEKWNPAGDLTFKKNTYYWQKGKPYIDKLVFKTISDDTQAVNQLKSGEVDAIESVPLENAKALSQGSDTKIQTDGSWVTEQVFFNTLDKNLSDVHVRRALALAINRDGLTKAVTFGYAKTAHSLLPTTITYNSDASVKALNYNVAAAKKELAKSTHPKGFTTTLLIASGNSAVKQEAQIIQAAGKAIGIHIKIQSVELATFRERFFAYNYSMMINSGQADFPDADSILAFQTDPKGFSKSYWTHYTNNTVTKLLYAGEQTADGPKRAKIYAQMQQILANEVPYIPLYYPDIVIGHRSSVKGLVVLPNGSVRFEDAYVK